MVDTDHETECGDRRARGAACSTTPVLDLRGRVIGYAKPIGCRARVVDWEWVDKFEAYRKTLRD